MCLFYSNGSCRKNFTISQNDPPRNEGDSLLLVCLFTWEVLRRFDFDLTSSGQAVIKDTLRIASTFHTVPPEGFSGFLCLAIGCHATYPIQIAGNPLRCLCSLLRPLRRTMRDTSGIRMRSYGECRGASRVWSIRSSRRSG